MSEKKKSYQPDSTKQFTQEFSALPPNVDTVKIDLKQLSEAGLEVVVQEGALHVWTTAVPSKKVSIAFHTMVTALGYDDIEMETLHSSFIKTDVAIRFARALKG